MERSWQSGLHRRQFISTHVDDKQDTIRLVSPINRFGLFQGNVSNDDTDFPPKQWKFRTKLIVTALVVILFAAALAGYLIGSTESKRVEPPDPIDPLKASASKLHIFGKAAVCTDSPYCSDIGRTMLLKNGSAIDAAIAAMFCNGIMNQQSMGIGGGFFMTIYIKEDEQAYTINARETAPGLATQNMFDGNRDKATKGPLAVGVPGEVRGMWVAHQRWGKLPWESLITPTLELCKNGYILSQVQHDGLETAPYIKNDPNLRKQYYNTLTGKFYNPGTIVKPSAALCNTFRQIAKKGGDELYNGSLAKDFLDDLNRAGSIITAEDLRNYKAQIVEPFTLRASNGDTLYSPPLPSSGLVLMNILNILNGYNFSKSSINTTDDKILTYHRILESFKYSYGMRTKLGDPDSEDMTEILKEVLNPNYGNEIRLKINDTATSNDTATYGVSHYPKDDAGTAHISIIAPNGDAISVTSSINFYFGAGFSTLNTGIVMNNVMDDFSSPGIVNYFGLPPSPANFIKPGKRPLSSMAPSIFVDKSGNAKLVIGASGGTKITSAIALVAMRKLWFDQTIKEAVDEARIHHQIFPMYVEYEFGIIQDIVKGLRAKGHGTVRYRGRGSIICALFRNSTAIYANADFRKGGDVSGM